MATFAPEFAQYWLTGHAGDADVAHAESDSRDTTTEEAALVELAERVSAARSVV